MSEPALPDKVVAIDQQLTRARIAHAFGGALALAYYAEPRATIDVDVNVFVPPADHGKVERALAPLGVTAEIDPAELEADGQCRWWWGRNPIDLFFSYDALHEAMKGAARRVPFGEVRIPVLGPEHLAVCKAVFARPKDWLDIEQIIVSADDLNVAEIADWLTRIVGKSDPRTRRFDRLAARA